MARGSRHQARQAAVQALYQWDLTEQSPQDIEAHFIHQHDLGNVDRAYFLTLVREVPLYRQEIEDNLSPFLDREFDNIDPVERAILRIGAYELEFRHDVPTNVIVNEAIELAKTFGAEHSYKFVNGILDKLARAVRPGGDAQPPIMDAKPVPAHSGQADE
ncbi:MAG: transcription antitermination factor NusB [Gammaproteobacteria bacterium]|nr:transcription antitermination factor NusB [Gammaproteobacteria bacterium]